MSGIPSRLPTKQQHRSLGTLDHQSTRIPAAPPRQCSPTTSTASTTSSTSSSSSTTNISSLSKATPSNLSCLQQQPRASCARVNNAMTTESAPSSSQAMYGGRLPSMAKPSMGSFVFPNNSESHQQQQVQRLAQPSGDKFFGLKPPRPTSIPSAPANMGLNVPCSVVTNIAPPSNKATSDRKGQHRVGQVGKQGPLGFQIAFQGGSGKVDKGAKPGQEGHKTIKSASSGPSRSHTTKATIASTDQGSSSGFSSGSRSDSTPSLCESEPADVSKKALQSPHQTNLSSCAGGPGRRLGIPPPKARPTSACIETITSAASSSFLAYSGPGHSGSGSLSTGNCANKSVNPSSALNLGRDSVQSGLRPLSSSGVSNSARAQTMRTPQTHHQQSSSSSPSVNPLISLEGRRQKSIEYLSEADSMSSSATSNCNIARVSPIRRQMGESDILAMNREKKGAEGSNTNCKTSLYETYDTRPPSLAHQLQQQPQQTSRTGTRRGHPHPQHSSTEPPRQFGHSDSKHGQRAATAVEEHENRLQALLRSTDGGGAPQATADCMSPASEATLSGVCKRDETSLFSVKVKVQQPPPQSSGPTTPSGSASVSTPNLHGNHNSNCTSGKGDAIHSALERPNINFAHLNLENPSQLHSVSCGGGGNRIHGPSQRRLLNQYISDPNSSPAGSQLPYHPSSSSQSARVLMKKSVSDNMLSVDTNGVALSSTGSSQDAMKQEQDSFSSHQVVRRDPSSVMRRQFSDGPTCPGKEFLRQKSANGNLGCGGYLSSMKEENETLTSNNALNKLCTGLASLASVNGNGSRTLPYRGVIDNQDSYSQHSLRSLVTPPPTPALSSASATHLRRLSETSDLRGSSSSLAGCSNFSANEEKQATEIKKLKSDLFRANEKVASLTSQLVTNSQMVSAFEQSLSSMTARLQQMSLSAEHKDREISRLKSTVDNLRKECSLINQLGGRRDSGDAGSNGDSSDRENVTGKKFSKPRSSSRDRAGESASSPGGDSTPGWLRGSITRAFRKGVRGPRSHKVQDTSFSDVESSRCNLSSTGSSNASSCHLGSHNHHPTMSASSLASPRFALGGQADERNGPEATELRGQLMDKERALTDIRLESLTTAHRMEGMKEDMKRMRLEIESLRQENKRLQRLLYKQQSMTSSLSSSGGNSVIQTHDPQTHYAADHRAAQKARAFSDNSCKDSQGRSADPLLNTLMRLQEAAAVD